MVKSVKRSPNVTIREKIFTKKTLSKFIYEVESILNKQSILPISDHINDFEKLTFNHFLIDSNCYNSVHGVFFKQDINLLREGRSVQTVNNMFRDRERKEYLPTFGYIVIIWYIVIISTKNIPIPWSMEHITEIMDLKTWKVMISSLITPYWNISWSRWNSALGEIGNKKWRTCTTVCNLYLLQRVVWQNLNQTRFEKLAIYSFPVGRLGDFFTAQM